MIYLFIEFLNLLYIYSIVHINAFLVLGIHKSDDLSLVIEQSTAAAARGNRCGELNHHTAVLHERIADNAVRYRVLFTLRAAYDHNRLASLQVRRLPDRQGPVILSVREIENRDVLFLVQLQPSEPAHFSAPFEYAPIIAKRGAGRNPARPRAGAAVTVYSAIRIKRKPCSLAHVSA